MTNFTFYHINVKPQCGNQLYRNLAKLVSITFNKWSLVKLTYVHDSAYASGTRRVIILTACQKLTRAVQYGSTVLQYYMSRRSKKRRDDGTLGARGSASHYMAVAR